MPVDHYQDPRLIQFSQNIQIIEMTQLIFEYNEDLINEKKLDI